MSNVVVLRAKDIEKRVEDLEKRESKETEERREPRVEELWWFWFSPSQTQTCSNPVLQNCRVLHFYFNKLSSDSVKRKMVAIANYRQRPFFIVGISLEQQKYIIWCLKYDWGFYFSLKYLISIPYEIGKKWFKRDTILYCVQKMVLRNEKDLRIIKWVYQNNLALCSQLPKDEHEKQFQFALEQGIGEVVFALARNRYITKNAAIADL